ncbi:unnamed protein product [Darwinula stevensoni]|uniref:Major facilitator superfamily (MFS) profile domain-containing protein n=1 Tax=Darwinula stevensoni TaxID=69355 RepID=A0A7R8WXW6_9CRUS|nr:unnamed protein product [Darwinula stevensoni]CAG0878837.1 unnamed protein product [Darwinula stevensoni]
MHNRLSTATKITSVISTDINEDNPDGVSVPPITPDLLRQPKRSDTSPVLTRVDDAGKDGHAPYRLLNQFMVVIMAGSNGYLWGALTGFTAMGLHSIKTDPEAPFNVTQEYQSLFGGGGHLGSMAGALTGGFVAELLGRKRVLLLYILVYMGAWLLIAFPASLAMFITGRLITGFVCGTRHVSVYMYVSECAHPKIRARIGTSVQCCQMLGVLLNYILGSYLPWRELAIINACLPLLLFIAILFIPESPMWLIAKGRMEAARASLQRLRGRDIDVSAEFQDMTSHFQNTKSSLTSWKMIFRFSYLKPIFLLLIMVILRQFTGFVVILYYAFDIFRESGIGMNPYHGTMILGSFQFVAYLVGGYIMDRLGRRRAIVVSASVMGVAEFSLAIFYFLKSQDHLEHLVIFVPWFPLLALMITMIGFSLGAGSIIVISVGELVPIQIKNKATGLINFFVTGFAFTILEVFFYMVDAIQFYGTFWVFSCCCFGLALYFHFVMPETKGESLSQIERKVTQTNLDSKCS